MNGESRLLVTDELVEYEGQLVHIQDFTKLADYCRGYCLENIHQIKLRKP